MMAQSEASDREQTAGENSSDAAEGNDQSIRDSASGLISLQIEVRTVATRTAA